MAGSTDVSPVSLLLDRSLQKRTRTNEKVVRKGYWSNSSSRLDVSAKRKNEDRYEQHVRIREARQTSRDDVVACITEE